MVWHRRIGQMNAGQCLTPAVAEYGNLTHSRVLCHEPRLIWVIDRSVAAVGPRVHVEHTVSASLSEVDNYTRFVTILFCLAPFLAYLLTVVKADTLSKIQANKAHFLTTV